MKTFKLLLAAAIILTAVSCTKEISDLPQVSKSDNIYQYGTMQKFLNREFEGTLTIKDLKTHGDFGLGTYNSVDGEMVVSDGKVYRIKTTGEAQEVGDSEISPFTVVKFFKADTSFVLDESFSFDELKTHLLNLIPDKSKPVAIKITGEYENLKTRTVEKQNKPYPSLEEIVANQIVFDFECTKGSAIGYWFPEYFQTVNFPAFHFHFLANSLEGEKEEVAGGGHLLDCTTLDVIIELDFADELVVGF